MLRIFQQPEVKRSDAKNHKTGFRKLQDPRKAKVSQAFSGC